MAMSNFSGFQAAVDEASSRNLVLRPTMNLRLVSVIHPEPNVPYVAAQGINGTGFYPYQLQQEWVSPEGHVREWRPIKIEGVV